MRLGGNLQCRTVYSCLGHCCVLYCIAVYCTALLCTVLHCCVLYCMCARTACLMAMLVGPPRLGIQKNPLVNSPSSAALVNALQAVHRGEN
jgi:hypothetical protein